MGPGLGVLYSEHDICSDWIAVLSMGGESVKGDFEVFGGIECAVSTYEGPCMVVCIRDFVG